MSFDAVLFDWRGTLVTSPGPRWAVSRALLSLHRSAASSDVDGVLTSISTANGDSNRLDTPGMDTDSAVHREISMAVFRDAGLDPDLSAALYAVDAEPGYNLFATDAARTLLALKDQGVRIAVVSDIHFDIRPHFDAAGLRGVVDVFTLSFELGAQKPNPLVFSATLDALGVEADVALMVGDRSHPDGAAVESGLTTLLLPPLSRPNDERLHRCLTLALPSVDGLDIS